MLEVSVIIPTVNERKNVLNFLPILTQKVKEIIIVDSLFSRDKIEEVEKLYPNVKVVKDKGKGKGDALRIGAKLASTDILIFMDGDGSHNIHDIPKLVKPIVRGEAVMAIASRKIGGSADKERSRVATFLRAFFGDLITKLINLRFSSNLLDSQNGFRAIRKDIFLQLKTRALGFDIETEITMKCLKKGFKIVEVPSFERKRISGVSRLKLKKHFIHYIFTFLRGSL